MSSVHAALAQRKTNGFKVDVADTPLYQLATIKTALAGISAVQLGGADGSMFVAPSAPSGLGASTNLPVSKYLTDLGKTLVIQFNDSVTKLQEVKYQSAATTFVTGYVVVESTWNAFAVQVSRV
jgi:hypothetical protein